MDNKPVRNSAALENLNIAIAHLTLAATYFGQKDQMEQYEREIEAEALASDAGQCLNCGLDHVLFFGASKCPRCGEGR